MEKVSNKSFNNRFLTTKDFDIITNQQAEICKLQCHTNASFFVGRCAEKYHSQLFQRRKHVSFLKSSTRQWTRNSTPVSWGNFVALNRFSQCSPFKVKIFLNRLHILRHSQNLHSFQNKKLGLRSQTSSHSNGDFASQIGKILSYDTASEHGKLPLKQVTTEAEGYLVDGYGWKVRDFDPKNKEDLRAIAEVQAKAFYIPFPFFNDFLYSAFKAEVLHGLIYKVQHSLPKRYTCLLAEPLHSKHKLEGFFSKEASNVIGVVDLTASGEREIVKCLSGTDEYLYLSSLAVESAYRRKSVATLLLQASDLKASEWGFKYLVLHAYEDDAAARRLYSAAGFQVIWEDPLWSTKWLGRQRRVAMAKRVSSQSSSDLEYNL